MRRAGEEGSQEQSSGRHGRIQPWNPFLSGRLLQQCWRERRTCGFLKISCRRYRGSEVYRVVCRCLGRPRIRSLLNSLRCDWNFSTETGGLATLICALYALHSATIADFAPGHSVVEALCQGGLPRVFVTDWRSAPPETRYFSIDNYLADFNVAVDELGPPAT
jgi:hypothetical protein